MHSRATPIASAERSRRLRSTSAWRAPGITVHGAPSRVMRAERRVGSRFWGVSTRDAVAHLDDGDVVAGEHEQHVGEPAAEHGAEVAGGLAVADGDRAARGRPAPKVEPSARPGRYFALVASSATASSVALAITVGTNGPGRHGPPELLDDDHELLEAVAGAAVLLGEVQAQPAELHEVAPERRGAPRSRPRAARGRRRGPLAWSGSPTRSRTAPGGLRRWRSTWFPLQRSGLWRRCDDRRWTGPTR